ncbi:MAG: HAMP domain-containing histidine kinase [Burkholderiales bacterium]|nr:HAMP domain-containing histidine kinase [Anaerolineae bacterium]
MTDNRPDDDSVADLMNITAHELKTPIGAVKGCIELLQQLGPLTDRQTHFAERALAILQHMEHMVSEMLDMGRLDSKQALNLVECDLRVVFEDALNMQGEVAEAREITLHKSIELGANLLMADAGLVAQVVNNLVSNAVKYNRNGGEVWLTASGDDLFVTISVRDTGLGISPEEQPRVFERFFRARETAALRIEGSGLGLAITEAIVRKHGGRIKLDSTPGKGSTFTVILPRRPLKDGTGKDLDEDGGAVVERSESHHRTTEHEKASEAIDAVSDSTQEPRGRATGDSQSDRV